VAGLERWRVVGVALLGVVRVMVGLSPVPTRDDGAGGVPARLASLDPVLEVEENGAEANVCSAETCCGVTHVGWRGWVAYVVG
jgi:hypothetical protein